MRALLAIGALCFSLSAWAQRGPEPARRVTVMDLEGDLIEGTSDRPDVEQVTTSPRPAHQWLIRVRQDFRAEAMRSVGAL
jgi:hypothetical protein